MNIIAILVSQQIDTPNPLLAGLIGYGAAALGRAALGIILRLYALHQGAGHH